MANNFEAGELSLEADYVSPYRLTQTLAGREVTFKTFGDEKEVDALLNKWLGAPMWSEEIRKYIDDMLEYLTWTIPNDGFDFAEDGVTELEPGSAHALRREWELKLTREQKRRLDKNVFSWNQLAGILNSLTYIHAFSQMENKREQFFDSTGTVPPLLAELAATAERMLADFEGRYKTLKYSERLALATEYRTFVKETVRRLFDAYTVTQAQEA